MATCAIGSPATTPIRTRRSGAGTTSGSIRRSRSWNIQSLLPGIRCPVLAVQGRDDEYGTLAQIEGIARAVPRDRTDDARCLRSFGAPRSAGASHPRGDRVCPSPPSTTGDRVVDAVTFLIQCLNAVQYGLLLFLVASGLTLIFGDHGRSSTSRTAAST